MTQVNAADKPVVMLRINPHRYLDASGKEVASPFKKTREGSVLQEKKTGEWEVRIAALKETMEGYLRGGLTPPEKGIYTHYFFLVLLFLPLLYAITSLKFVFLVLYFLFHDCFVFKKSVTSLNSPRQRSFDFKLR